MKRTVYFLKRLCFFFPRHCYLIVYTESFFTVLMELEESISGDDEKNDLEVIRRVLDEMVERYFFCLSVYFIFLEVLLKLAFQR